MMLLVEMPSILNWFSAAACAVDLEATLDSPLFTDGDSQLATGTFAPSAAGRIQPK